jgi:thioredoxin-related protein
MNKVINEIKKEKQINIEELDFDFDDVSKYNPGTIMPVFIFFDQNGNEIKRLIGEHKKEEILEYI